MSRQSKKDRRIRGHELHVMSGRDFAAQKRMRNPLTALSPRVVRNLYETYRRGFYADIQLNWDAIEEYDETLGTVVDRRQAALGEMGWDVRADLRLVGDNAALQELAERQRVYMTARFNRVGNLMEAIKWLGMANFRRAAFVQVFEQPGADEEVWRRVPPWCLSHPDHEGPWVYDETAAAFPHKADEVLMEHVICREVERPIDLPCLALVVAKNMGVTNWDGFLDTFGIPAVMVKMPPDTTDERREEFMDIAREIIGDGRGVFPDGTEIKTIEATQNFAAAFTERVDWCDRAMVRRATGGMLTVLAESGSGTLAGGAHMEAFRQLAANDAASIAECINRQYVRRALAEAFPGEPALVYFDLTPPVTDDRAAQAGIIATLAQAGFKPSAETVSEMMGFEVAAVQQQPDLPLTIDSGAPHRALTPLGRPAGVQSPSEPSGALTNSAPVAQAVTNSRARDSEPNSINGQWSIVNGQSPESAPLSEAELSALNTLATGGLSAEGLQDTSQALAEALQGAVTNGCTKMNCDKHPHRNDATGALSHKQKGGHSTKGNPKNANTKSNTPLKATPNAKPQAQVDATEHALKSREGGGGVVEEAAWANGKRIDVRGGSPDTGGASHMPKHYKPGDTSRRTAAKDIILGRRQKDREEIAAIGKKNKVILADKGNRLEPVTTRRKKDND